MADLIFYAAVTFFVTLNPVGLVPLFIGITAREKPEDRASLAARAATIAGILLLAFMFLGQLLFDALGIHLGAFRIAGGLVLLLTSLRMVIGSGSSTPEETGEAGDLALFPLALPNIAGPAAIMSAILMTENDTVPLRDQLVVAAVAVAMIGVCYLAMRVAVPLQRYLGTTGANVITRVLGLILASIAAEHILAGLRLELGLGGT
jgi:multiple antibiotic resistance protein